MCEDQHGWDAFALTSDVPHLVHHLYCAHVYHVYLDVGAVELHTSQRHPPTTLVLHLGDCRNTSPHPSLV